MSGSEINFQSIMNQMEQNLQQDQDAFGLAEDNPNRLLVTNTHGLYGRELSEIELENLRKIQEVDDYAWSRGAAGGLTTGFPLFDEGVEGGLQVGLILLAASPNVGKSAFMLQVLKNVSELNDKVYVEYISLDDTTKTLGPRYVACDQQITIGQARNPEKYLDQPDIIERRNEGFKTLYRNVHRFALKDVDNGNSIESLEERVMVLKMALPEDTQIVIGIDSFYDIVSEQSMGEKEMEFIAKEVKRLAKQYDVIIMCTAHLRKLNANRRPQNDDLKETNRLEYEADLICLLYNEVGTKEESADVYWLSEQDEDQKMPVLECRFSKNKFSDYKGTRFYEFIPAQSYFVEAPVESSRRYASLIHQR